MTPALLDILEAGPVIATHGGPGAVGIFSAQDRYGMNASAYGMARGIYVHLPFCPYICPYCDFAKWPHRRSAAQRYLQALHAEIEVAGEPQFRALRARPSTGSGWFDRPHHDNDVPRGYRGNDVSARLPRQ